jgi:hypothetical protein
MTVNIADVELEVLKGLANERPRLNDALRAVDYYALRNEKYIPRRDAESEQDYADRPKKYLPFCRRVVQVLTKHLYSPGPARVVTGDAAATKWLTEVYRDCLVNALWQRADRLALLGGASAFQVAASGDPARPIALKLWGPDELAVWPDNGDPPEAVVTIDRYDGRRRYQLWTADEIREYRTKKWGDAGTDTAGGTAPEAVGPPKPNPYGILPFAFQHAELPTCSAWEGSIGAYLSDTNGAVDDQLSDLSHAIKRFHYPLGVAENCDPSLQVIHKFGSFIRLNTVLQQLDHVPTPKLAYLQAQLDILGAWHDIESTLYQALDHLEIPRAAWRMETAQVASGIAIVAEQLPLIDRARARREPQRVYETELAKVVFTVAGNYVDPEGGSYDGSDRHRGVAEDLELSLTWPEPTIPIPGPDRDDSDRNALELGTTSRVMVLMDRYGLDRDQALERLKQIAADRKDAQRIDPPPITPEMPYEYGTATLNAQPTPASVDQAGNVGPAPVATTPPAAPPGPKPQ